MFNLKKFKMKRTNNVLMTMLYLFFGLFLFSSCNSADSSKDSMSDSTNAMTEAPSATDSSSAKKLTDPEIASIALTADQIDIDYAAIAKEKSKNADVLKFAATMTKDHTSVNDQAKALAAKLNVTPLDNPTTQSLLSGAATTKEMLNSKSGADFDKAYVDNEVSYHKAAIDLVENTLIPDASNEELKSLLQTALPIFKEHLAHAEALQKTLSK